MLDTRKVGKPVLHPPGSLERLWRIEPEHAYDVSQLLAYAEGALFLNDWEANVTSGRWPERHSRRMLSKRIGRTSRVWVYSLAYANDSNEFVNNGRPIPYKYDRDDLKGNL